MSLSQQQQQQRISLLRYNPTTNTATPTNYRSICDEGDDQEEHNEEHNENTTTATTTIAAAAAVHHVVSNGGSNTTIRNHHHNNHHRSPSAVSTTTHTTGVKSSTVSLRPMGYLTNNERRKRYRFIIVMVLLCIGIAVTLVLWFYSIHVVSPTKTQRRWWWWWDPSDHRHHSNDTSFRNKYNNANTNLYDSSRLHNEMQHIANTAVQNLNTNFVTSSGDEIIPDSCETTLLVFRHCDKLDTTTDDDGNVNHKYSHDNNHDDSTLRNKHRNRYCSEIGYDRAQYITTLFGNTNTSRWPVPNYLWALSSHRAKYENYREYETLLPLSQMISVPIQNVSSSTTPADTFANQYFFPLLTTKQMCGQISVVSWKHHWIPALVQALGCGPDNGCPMFYPTDTFDAVWELKFIFHSTTTSSESTDSTLPRTTGLLPTRDEDTESSSNSVVVKPSVSTFHLLRKKNRKKHHHHHHRHKSNDDDKNILPIPNTWESDTTNVTNHPPHWIVMGTVTYQMFDPLQYSTQLGHYPHAMGDP